MGGLLSQFADDLPGTQLFDTFYIPDESLVTFSCENKDITVRGIVVDPFQFQLQSKWDAKALGSIADSHVLRASESWLQGLGGVSINQPVFNRKNWGGTSPFETTLKVRFVAVNSDLEDVYLPVIKLLCLLLPRAFRSPEGLAGIVGIFSIPGPAPFLSESMDTLLHKLDPDMPAGQHVGGDSVSVRYGNILNVQDAYITEVKGAFSKSLGPKGYPLAAEVYVSFGAMDTPFFVKPTSGAVVGEITNNVFKCTNHMAKDLGTGMSSAVDTLLEKATPETVDAVSAADVPLSKTTVPIGRSGK